MKSGTNHPDFFRISGKLIVIGDVHFGVKKFNIEFLRDTLKFFNEQLFPYMIENNIKEIFQLGDLFDNRTTMDILFLQVLKEEFFDILKEKGFILRSLLGNHDLYFRESRDVSLIKQFRDLYPDNFILYEDRETIQINEHKTYVVPWIVKGEDLNYEEIKDKDSILGHFEIRHFHLVKGHIDNSAKLTADFFTENTQVKNVFSGHYHIKDTKGLVKYLGTPIWINWSDFDEQKGFYVWDEFDNLEFIDNIISKKFVKIKYNDEKTDDDRNIEIQGLFAERKMVNDEELKVIYPLLEKHELKFFINKSVDRHFDEVLYSMKESKIQATIIDNQELSEIIGTDYINEDKNNHFEDTRSLVTNTVKDSRPELLSLIIDILTEIDSTELKHD